jgi:hypothetical protein
MECKIPSWIFSGLLVVYTVSCPMSGRVFFFFWDRIAWGSDLQSTYICDWIARNGWLVIRMKWETTGPLCVRT